MRAAVTLVKSRISDLRGDGSPHILFGSCKPSLALAATNEEESNQGLRAARGPSTLHGLGQRLSRIHGRERAKDAKATTTKNPLLYVCLTHIGSGGM